MTRVSRVVPALALALSSACSPAPRPAPAPSAGAAGIVLGSPLYMWIQATADGGWAARMILPGGGVCPSDWSLRAAPSDSFPVVTCEIPDLPPLAEVRVGGRRLAAFNPQFDRVVVIGDTGCQYDKQNCADSLPPQPHQKPWPFAAVAAAAADSSPDLVVHVGDYLYRETCEEDEGNCADDWAGWQADFFAPADSLLARSPWIFTRGNHEQCGRGAKGWFRFLDPRPFTSDTACAQFTDPFVVPVPGVGRVLVFDTACAPKEGVEKGQLCSPDVDAVYGGQFTQAARLLASDTTPTWLATHAPVWAWRGGSGPDSVGTDVLDKALADSLQGRLPPSISLLLHGHIHIWEAIGFAGGQRPPVIVAGNAGTAIHDVPTPFPPTILGDSLTTSVLSTLWGFTMLTPSGGGWNATLISPLAPDSTRSCSIAGRQITCR